MSHTWDDLPKDIREDIPRAPRPAQERLLRQVGWTDEEIRRLLGPTESEKEAEAEEAAALDKQESRRKWWTAQWIPLATLIVAFLTLLVALASLFLR